MIDYFKQSLIGQYLATLAMFKHRVEVCPEEYFDGKIGNSSFREHAYHTLFFLDYYLSPHEKKFVKSELNRKGGNELSEKISKGLNKVDTLAYIEFCKNKIHESVLAETQETFEGECGFPSIFVRRKLTRGELHIYNIRHVQHHIGQMSTYLRTLSDTHQLDLNLNWYSNGWYD